MPRIFDDEIALSYPPCTVERGKDYAGTVFGGIDWYDFSVRPQGFDDAVLTSIQTGMNDLYARVSRFLTFFKIIGGKIENF